MTVHALKSDTKLSIVVVSCFITVLLYTYKQIAHANIGIKAAECVGLLLYI